MVAWTVDQPVEVAAERSDETQVGTTFHRMLATTRAPATMYSSKTSTQMNQRVAASTLLNFTFPSNGHMPQHLRTAGRGGLHPALVEPAC